MAGELQAAGADLGLFTRRHRDPESTPSWRATRHSMLRSPGSSGLSPGRIAHLQDREPGPDVPAPRTRGREGPLSSR